MHLRRTSAATALAVLAGLVGGLGLPAATAYADGAVTLPITHFAHMVVADGHVFISSGEGSTSLLVTDLDGSTVGTVPNEDGAFGLAVSPDGDTVYAALPNEHAISAVNASTLAETARYASGDTVQPTTLAFAAGRLWFGYSGQPGQGGIGSVDLSTSPATVSLGTTTDYWYSAPLLTASATHPDLLAAADEDTDPPYVSVYDASGAALVTTAHQRIEDAGSAADLQFTQDGADLIMASGAPYVHQAYRVSDLSPDWSYPTGAYPDAVAVAPDGTVAAGSDAYYSSTSVSVYADSAVAGNDGTQLNSYGFLENDLVRAGLAWTPDGGSLFAVTSNGAATTYTLRVYDDAGRSTPTLALRPPSTVAPGRPLTVTGSLTAPLAIPVGTHLHVTRTGPGNAPAAVLDDAVTTAGGDFTITDTPAAAGDYAYLVSYDGDSTHRPVSTAADVQVARLASTITLHAPASATRGATLTVTGSLANGPYPGGETVQVRRIDAASPKGTALHTAVVGANGAFTVKDAPPVGGPVTYQVDYPGDTAHAASTASGTVQVSRAATKVTVATNAASYGYAATATVTAHLGTTYNGRTVSIYALPYQGAKVLVKTGKVDAKGNLTGSYKLSRGTTFSVAFAGDYRYAPAAATRAVTVHASVHETLGGYYTSTHVGSTLYRVYHHTAQPGVTVGISPNKAGECVKLTLQEYYSKAWHTTLTVACAKLDSHSSTAGSLVLKNATGHSFRIEAEYLPGKSDHGNLATTGPWLYFSVRS